MTVALWLCIVLKLQDLLPGVFFETERLCNNAVDFIVDSLRLSPFLYFEVAPAFINPTHENVLWNRSMGFPEDS